MTDLQVLELRGRICESTHRVSAAVVDAQGSLVARSGDPGLVTYMRSAAKPLQTLAVVQDGAAERYAMTPEELALACASHSSEVGQVELVAGLLRRIGCRETDLACGPHRPLGLIFSVPPLGPEAVSAMSPVASNCSGKHAAMLALARHRGWRVGGYHRPNHPVQRRMKQEVVRWTGMAEAEIGEGVDGCGVVTFALPLDRMAHAMARLATADGAPERAVISAMMKHPELVGGQRRLCTELMQAYPAAVVAKVGAAGVYAAALPDRGLGLCLKVEDGDAAAAMAALLAALDALGLDPRPSERLARFARLPLLNTCKERVGTIRAAGCLRMV